jgi:VanZ family protein
VLVFLWGLFIIYGTLLPFRFSTGTEQVSASLQRLRERPWGSGSRVDAISNVLLFLPWGFLVAVWQAERNASLLASLLVPVLSGAALSASVESVQLFAPGRITSLLDLITNSLGSALGGVAGWLFARRIWPGLSTRSREMLANRPALACALAAAAGLTIMGLSPFAVSVQVNELKTAVKSAHPIPFGPALDGREAPREPWKWGAELLTWSLAGGLFVQAAREAGRRGGRAVIWAAGACVALCLGIEILQLMIPSRACDMTSVVMALLGATLGAALVDRTPERALRRWFKPALLIWLAIAALTHWTPPPYAWPEMSLLRAERFIPFWAYYLRTNADALGDVIDQVLLFIPLGIILGVASRRGSIVRAALIGLAIGSALELGQLFLPQRTVEITDALSAAAGSGIGMALWHWGTAVRDRTSAHGTARYRLSEITKRSDPPNAR